MKPQNQSPSKTLKGIFKPKFPEKYRGNPTNIVFRSSYELKCMEFFDLSPNVMWWQSEERSIAYRSPETNTIRRYFPDFIVCMKDKTGKINVHMIEVKPFSQTQPPKKKTMSPKYIKEVMRYGVNSAKWKAAQHYCKEKGWEFTILTENEIFGNKYSTSKKR